MAIRFGTPFGDTLIGTSGFDLMLGNDGDDFIWGRRRRHD